MGDKNKNSRNKINTSALKNSGIPDPIAILTGKPGSRITTSPQGISFPSKPEEKTKENNREKIIFFIFIYRQQNNSIEDHGFLSEVHL
jgi:hypothetical protein